LGGCEPQVAGHVAANLNVGNERGLLIAVTTQLVPFIGYPRVLNALRVIDEIAPFGSDDEAPGSRPESGHDADQPDRPSTQTGTT
jgi:4-carboxymuconolactone decarboxylase